MKNLIPMPNFIYLIFVWQFSRSIDYRSTLFEPTQGSLAASSLTYECPMAIAPQPPIDSASRPIILRRDDEEDADDGSHAYEPVVVRKAWHRRTRHCW